MQCRRRHTLHYKRWELSYFKDNNGLIGNNLTQAEAFAPDVSLLQISNPMNWTLRGYSISITGQFIQEDLFHIGGDISGFPTSYTAHALASNFISSRSFDSTFDLTSCKEDKCCQIELPSSFYCPQSTVISVTISAANRLGEGPHSNPFMIGILYKMLIDKYLWLSYFCRMHQQFCPSSVQGNLYWINHLLCISKSVWCFRQTMLCYIPIM